MYPASLVPRPTWEGLHGYEASHILSACMGNHISPGLNVIYTVGLGLIAWFNDCIFGKLGRTANVINVLVNIILYYIYL